MSINIYFIGLGSSGLMDSLETIQMQSLIFNFGGALGNNNEDDDFFCLKNGHLNADFGAHKRDEKYVALGGFYFLTDKRKDGLMSLLSLK